LKRYTLLAFLVVYSSLVSGQLIRGRVVDKDSQQPVDFASIYIEGTFVGTTPSENGEFALDVSEYAGRPLYISAVGYQTTSLDTQKKLDFHTIYLKKTVYELDEVVLESASLVKKREKYLKIFRKEFLGTSKNAKNCFILNEEAISFNYKTDRDTLKAFSREPLIILNNSLGYQITYYLGKFEFDRSNNTTTFTGNISFNKDLSNIGQSREDMKFNRKKTYLGSSKHFFTSLWEGNLLAEGFYVQKVRTADALKEEDFVFQDSRGKKYFLYNEDLEISYDHYQTTVHFLRRMAFFDRDGFFEPEAILWYGYMSHARIADWLPYEYIPEH